MNIFTALSSVEICFPAGARDSDRLLRPVQGHALMSDQSPRLSITTNGQSHKITAEARVGASFVQAATAAATLSEFLENAPVDLAYQNSKFSITGKTDVGLMAFDAALKSMRGEIGEIEACLNADRALQSVSQIRQLAAPHRG